MSLRALCDELRVAGMFFTRLPMGHVARTVPMPQTAWAWPLLGALLGALFGLAHWVANWLGLPPSVAMILAMGTLLLAGGALHEDGLADLADGIGGGTNPARRLDIMRDSRLGSYGAMALILAFLLSYALWREIERPLAVAVAVGAVSRMALPLWLRIFPAARADGLGAQMQAMPSGRIAAALGMGAGLALALLPFGAALAMLMACLGAQFALCLYARKHILGVSGDVMGAAQVLGSLAGLLTQVGA